ncbi:MAG: RIP metalloprotease RseP [Mycoplasmatales bacterium]
MISVIINILAFVIMLGIIVFIHELGHLLVAKYYGVFCHEFAIGMGPKVKTIYTDKTGTVYNIRLLPIGGFVQMAGEIGVDLSDSEKKQSAEVETFVDDLEGSENNQTMETAEKKIEFNDADIPKEQLLDNQKPLPKIAIMAAGAIMNFILAFVLLVGISFFVGYQTIPTEELEPIITVAPNSPAETAGLTSNSKVLKVGEKEITNFGQLINEIQQQEKTFKMTVQAEGTTDQKELTITKNAEDKIGVGVSEQQQTEAISKYQFIGSLQNGAERFTSILSQMVYTVKSLVTGENQVNELGGVISIYTVSSQAAQAGLASYIMLIAFLSINIGFLNLLPIPALDGGRIVFALYELIMRKRVNAKFEMYVNTAGFVFLIGLMIFALYNDVLRIGG